MPSFLIAIAPAIIHITKLFFLDSKRRKNSLDIAAWAVRSLILSSLDFLTLLGFSEKINFANH